MNRQDVYQAVTDRIVAAIQEGDVAPWRKPWTGGEPISLSTGKAYRGINVFLLGLMPYSDPRWGTFRAVKNAGGFVRKGEKSTWVILWKPVKKRNQGEDEEADTYLLLKMYPVFNADQCDGLPALPKEREHVADDRAEEIANGYVGPTLAWGSLASYSQTLDIVTMPKPERFESGDAYYSTLYHELVHSTGHKDRLDRLESTGFGTGPYAKEELVAEMGAAMLCGIAHIRNEDQSAAYVSHWLERLQSDPKLVVQAAAQAQRASDLILGTTFEESNDKEEVAAAA